MVWNKKCNKTPIGAVLHCCGFDSLSFARQTIWIRSPPKLDFDIAAHRRREAVILDAGSIGSFERST